jgi:hypothetical protein
MERALAAHGLAGRALALGVDTSGAMATRW